MAESEVRMTIEGEEAGDVDMNGDEAGAGAGADEREGGTILPGLELELPETTTFLE
jgi:hypothetical protein